MTLGVFLVSGCAEAEAKHAPNVLLVCIDTLRADHVGCYGYDRRATTPTLDALASESIVFLDTSATASWTKPSVPSFMTGTFPAQHGVYEGSSKDGAGRISHVLPEDAVTLAEVFRERGYRTGAFIQNAQLRRGQGIEQGFDSYVDRAGDARAIRWQALDWIAEAPDDRPFFLYLHFLDAHWPYPVPDEYASRFTPHDSIERFRSDDWKGLRDAINEGEAQFDAVDRHALEALYDGAIRYVDDELGRLFEGLTRHGLWSETVLSVISDHGEEFGEHGHIGHGHGLWENLLAVPWILRVPNRPAARVETAVSLVDLFPTLLAASGVASNQTTAGTDRLAALNSWANSPAVRSAARGPILAEHKTKGHYLQSLRDGDMKLVRRFERNAPPATDAWAPALSERWEAELARGPANELLVTQLKRLDGESDDPSELKGMLSSVHDDHFVIGGIKIRRTAETEVRQSASTTVLKAGVLAKARFAWRTNGPTALRVKLYPPGTRPAFEIRGTVIALDGRPSDGALTLAGFELRMTPATTFQDAARRRRLTRSDVRDFLNGRSSDTDRVTLDLWRVRSHRESLVHFADWVGTLGARLDRLGAEHAEARTYSREDRASLNAEELGQLSAIGYLD